MLTRLCVVVPGLAPGIDAVPGAALEILILREFYVVLVKILTGLTDAVLFHNYHLTYNIPGGDHQVNRW